MTRLPDEFRRRDVRHPRLARGERLALDFVAQPQPGDVVLVRDGTFRLAVAPSAGLLVAVVRELAEAP